MQHSDSTSEFKRLEPAGFAGTKPQLREQTRGPGSPRGTSSGPFPPRRPAPDRAVTERTAWPTRSLGGARGAKWLIIPRLPLAHPVLVNLPAFGFFEWPLRVELVAGRVDALGGEGVVGAPSSWPPSHGGAREPRLLALWSAREPPRRGEAVEHRVERAGNEAGVFENRGAVGLLRVMREHVSQEGFEWFGDADPLERDPVVCRRGAPRLGWPLELPVCSGSARAMSSASGGGRTSSGRAGQPA